MRMWLSELRTLEPQELSLRVVLDHRLRRRSVSTTDVCRPALQVPQSATNYFALPRNTELASCAAGSRSLTTFAPKTQKQPSSFVPQLQRNINSSGRMQPCDIESVCWSSSYFSS